MARYLQFDRESALDLALDQFWVHGFNDTSMRDLAERLGVSLSSLYNSFGDKRALFLAVLDRYDIQYLSARLASLEQDYPPMEAIKRFFESVIDDCASDPMRKGCFLVNTALELSPHDEVIEARVRESLSSIEAFLLRALKRSKKDGTLKFQESPASLAARLMATVLGIRVLARANPDPAKLRAILTGTLDLLVH